MDGVHYNSLAEATPWGSMFWRLNIRFRLLSCHGQPPTIAEPFPHWLRSRARTVSRHEGLEEDETPASTG